MLSDTTIRTLSNVQKAEELMLLDFQGIFSGSLSDLSDVDADAVVGDDPGLRRQDCIVQTEGTFQDRDHLSDFDGELEPLIQGNTCSIEGNTGSIEGNTCSFRRQDCVINTNDIFKDLDDLLDDLKCEGNTYSFRRQDCFVKTNDIVQDLDNLLDDLKVVTGILSPHGNEEQAGSAVFRYRTHPHIADGRVVDGCETTAGYGNHQNSLDAPRLEYHESNILTDELDLLTAGLSSVPEEREMEFDGVFHHVAPKLGTQKKKGFFRRQGKWISKKVKGFVRSLNCIELGNRTRAVLVCCASDAVAFQKLDE